MKATRRSFLAAAAATPWCIGDLTSSVASFWAPRGDRRALIVLELVGGNDGLNTVIPAASARYPRLRSKLDVRKGSHALADGTARGTGKYRPPALVRVRAAAPYFHHGAVATLDDVLSPERLEPSYRRGVLGQGAVPGHAFGTDLPAADRRALVSWLSTL